MGASSHGVMLSASGQFSGVVLGDGTTLGDVSSHVLEGDYYRAVRRGVEVNVFALHPWMVERVSLARFAGELAACPDVDHPAVARVLRHGQEGEAFYVTSELLGEPVDAALDGGPLDVPAALTLGLRVAEGLCAIHAAGGVHGGLSTRSIFLPDSGEPALARIAARDLVPGTSALRHDGRSITLYGAPPLLGDALFGVPLDERSDLASLALTLYELLGGHFTLEDEYFPFAAMQRYASGTLVELQRFRPEVPRDLAALLAQTYAPDPKTRPQSAHVFRDALLALTPRTSNEPP